MPRAARPDLAYKAICAGHVQWKDSAVRNMLQDQRTQGFTTKGVDDLLIQHVRVSGLGCVRAKAETDPYWLGVYPDDPWWYKVNIVLPDRPQKLFVKMKMVDPDDEEDPWVEIVGCHF